MRHAAAPILALALLLCTVTGARAVAIEPGRAQVLLAADAALPADDDPRWQATELPDSRNLGVAWYRIEFDYPADAPIGYWMLYLPFFYGGGGVWLNGQPLARITESSATLRVRWERPLLLPLPAADLRPGRNVLHLRAASAHLPSGIEIPRLVVGTQDAVQPQFDRRLFFVRTVPVITVVVGAVAGLLFVGVGLRRRQETLYLLLGVAALLWAARTTTFVFDAMPASAWLWWRLLYHATNGGFIITLALFALRLAGWQRRGLTLALVGYELLGPALYLLPITGAEELVGRWWVAGLIPIGLSVAVVTAAAAWRQRTAGVVMIAVAVALAFAAGVHDYLVAWRSPLIEALLPRWSDHRLFLLHYGANLLLVAMAVLLTVRLVRSLHEVEEANRTLEARVTAREREINTSYQRIAVLQREQAALDERQRIMQDLHDGLGSQLFTSLMRAERGALDSADAAAVLRGSIDEMRVAIEALASDERDFRTAFGNFRFRWDPRLREAGLAPDWQIDLPDAVLEIPPHDALQLLRIVQEALTNTLKHAQARRVTVALRREGDQLLLAVQDDGRGSGAGAGLGSLAGGRGLSNMKARAARLGAALDVDFGEGGTRVALAFTLMARQAS